MQNYEIVPITLQPFEIDILDSDSERNTMNA